jgi:hypothetical protein
MGMMTWGQLRMQIQQSAPGLSKDLLDEYLNTRYARVLEHRAWSWLEQSAYVESTAPYCSTTDTVAVTQGSNAITGTGTTWTSGLNGLKFQVVSDGPFYTFTYVSATSATIDRVYEGTTTTASAYRLFTNVYPLPDDFKAILQEQSAENGFDLKPLDEVMMGEQVGFRDAIGTPEVYAITPSPEALDGGFTWQIEMFPIPRAAKGYPIRYLRAAPSFDGTTTGDNPLPFVSDAVILAGCRAEVFAHLKDFNSAGYYEGRFTDELKTMTMADTLKQPIRQLQMARRFTRHRVQRLMRNSFPRIPG